MSETPLDVELAAAFAEVLRIGARERDIRRRAEVGGNISAKMARELFTWLDEARRVASEYAAVAAPLVPRRIVVGDLFTWGTRPAISIEGLSGVEVRDAYIVFGRKPRRWWYFVSWVRVARQLWRLP